LILNCILEKVIKGYLLLLADLHRIISIMGFDAYITIFVIALAVALFITELITIDLVSILVMVVLILTGVISPEEGVQGFSNNATITVVFMFILSATVLKTGSLQYVAYKLSNTFRYNYKLGMVLMMVLIAVISAFVNNTPVVVIFIPVIIQIAHASGQSPTKMLIPLSFASIFGGTCTLIGTSTNILVSGIAEKSGLEGFGIFDSLGMGLVFVVVGILYMIFVGDKLLPSRTIEKDLNTKFNVSDYLTEIELLENANSVGKKIMDSALVRELEMDVLQVIRGESKFTLPQGDFVLQAGDLLKVKCNIEKIKTLKNRVKINVKPSVKIGGNDLQGSNSTILEMVMTAGTDVSGKTLKEIDFRRKYRAVPLAIKQRDGVVHDNLYEHVLTPGDIILAEVKTHYVEEMKKLERNHEIPFAVLSESVIQDFDKKKTFTVLAVIAAVVGLASFDILDIMTGTIAGVTLLVLLKALTMKEAYAAVNWKIIFLLVGSLSLGTAMHNSELDVFIANGLVNNLGTLGGNIAILSGLYLVTSILTEVISNHAAAALLAPIAIAAASSLGINATPFLMTIMFAASASFMTPIGYHNNTMVYSAGNYKFTDFLKVGTPLNILFWIIATIFIPIFFPFEMVK
jgi:di/tricarboxylate transporter